MKEDLKAQIKESVVRSLRLTIVPADIPDDSALFGSGLGLDSIDALELVLELERRYGLKITDERMGKRVFASVNAIAAAIEELRAPAGGSGGPRP